MSVIAYNREAAFAIRAKNAAGAIQATYVGPRTTYGGAATSGNVKSITNTSPEIEKEDRELLNYRNVPFVKGFRGRVTIIIWQPGVGQLTAAPQTLEAVLAYVNSLVYPGCYLEAAFAGNSYTRVNLESVTYAKLAGGGPAGTNLGIEVTLELSSADLLARPYAPAESAPGTM